MKGDHKLVEIYQIKEISSINNFVKSNKSLTTCKNYKQSGFTTISAMLMPRVIAYSTTPIAVRIRMVFFILIHLLFYSGMFSHSLYKGL